MSTLWKSRYALRTLGIKSSTIRELLKVTQRPEVISFGGGMPAPEVFPLERFAEACQKVLAEHGAESLQYGASEGYQPLRELIARNMARYGILSKAENVLITSGSQQALDLIGKLLINPGDSVLVEAPTYLGALQAFSVYGAQYVFRAGGRGRPGDRATRVASAHGSEVHVRAAELSEPSRSHAVGRASPRVDPFSRSVWHPHY
jgi:2-aminoadipate transaminase